MRVSNSIIPPSEKSPTEPPEGNRATAGSLWSAGRCLRTADAHGNGRARLPLSGGPRAKRMACVVRTDTHTHTHTHTHNAGVSQQPLSEAR